MEYGFHCMAEEEAKWSGSRVNGLRMSALVIPGMKQHLCSLDV